ncbi:MAG: hypothetical protein ACRC7V_07250, partial [Lachnospiraceae bacterium]
TIVNEELISFKELEKKIYCYVCELAREITQQMLERYDKELSESRDKVFINDIIFYDLYNKGKLDLLICKSKSDLDRYENTIDSIFISNLKSGILAYCVRDGILIRNVNIISLSQLEKYPY